MRRMKKDVWRNKQLITIIFSCLASVSQCQEKSGFLYVPEGKSVNEGIILHEISQQDLPPGEYEIVARFDDPNAQKSPFSSQHAASSRFDVEGSYHYAEHESPYKSLPPRHEHHPIEPHYPPSEPHYPPPTAAHPPIYDFDYSNQQPSRPVFEAIPRETFEQYHPTQEPPRFQHFPDRADSMEEAKRMIYPPQEQQQISSLPPIKKRFPPPRELEKEQFYPPRVDYPHPYEEESRSKDERFHNSNDLQQFFPKHHQQYSPVSTEHQMPISVYSMTSHSDENYHHHEEKEKFPLPPPVVSKPKRKIHYRPPSYPELEEPKYHNTPAPTRFTPRRPSYEDKAQEVHHHRPRPTIATRLPQAYDPRKRNEEKPALDHWAGYPGYPDEHRRRFSANNPHNSLQQQHQQQQQQHHQPQYQHQPQHQPQLFVTPLPKKKHSKKSIDYRANRPDLKRTKQRANAEELKKLYDIASSKKTRNNVPDFKCPRDGHFGDNADCAKYYHCAHGKAHVEYCTGGLFWNAVTDQCDWPETVDCSYNAANLAAFRAKEPTKIYLTFDDGPNEGTDAILRALRNSGVKATFFLNSQYLHHPNKQQSAQNALNILTMVHDGHTLADHSYDHMYHNSKNSPQNAYKDVEEDLKYFGIMNTYPVLDTLWKADMKKYIPKVNHTMTYNVRMPYTNNWRIAPDYRRDCQACTVPASSGMKGIEIADSLHAQGKQVIGWDLEWAIDWNRNRFKHGGKEMFFKMARDNPWLVQKGKIVLLSHDIAHRDYEKRDEQKELEIFIRLAKEAGYEFDTIDNYSL